MAYIGKTPTSGDFVLLDSITTSATASYTMQKNSVNFEPQSANHMIVSLNGTIQAPVSSFTVSGSTLTFASALTSSDVIDFILVLGNVNDVGTATTVVDSAITNNKLNLISTSSTPGLTVKGDGSSENGTIQLNCSQNSHGVKLSSPDHSAGQSYELILPTGNVTADRFLKVDSVSGSGTTGIGQLSFAEASGSLVKIASGSTTSGSVSYVDVAGCFTSTYKIYKLYIYDVNTASDTALYMRWLTGSSTEQAGSSAYHYGISGYNSSNGGSNNGGAATYMNLIGEDIRQDNDEHFALEGTIYNPAGTTLKTRFNFLSGGRRTGNYTVVGAGSAEWNSATAVTGFRFLTNTGNLDSMYYVVYGLVI